MRNQSVNINKKISHKAYFLSTHCATDMRRFRCDNVI